MKTALRILILALVLIIALPLVSCKGNSPQIDNVRENFIYLIEESRELNHIFFGAGLPVYSREDALTEQKMVYFIDELPGFDRINENSEYLSVEEIKADAEKIYSKDYLLALYESAFDGILVGDRGSYIRFYEGDDWLYQNTNATDFNLSEKIFDYSTMEIAEPSTSEYVNVRIECYSISDGARREYILSFVLQDGGWRLDSPTY